MSEFYNEVPSAIAIPPNRSEVLLDSKYRIKDEDHPTDFTTYLSGGVVALELQYRNLFWTMPFYTHNTTNNEIRFILEHDDDIAQPTYVCYVMPWTIFKTFDGLTSGGGFNPPATGSYAKEIEVAMADIRLLTDNTNPIATPTVGGNAISFYCEYNQANGFLLYCKDSLNAAVSFRLLDCNWIEKGFNIHGFGIFDRLEDRMRPKHYNDNSVFYTSYLSDATPALTESKYITIYCDQLSRERKLPSYRNISNVNGNGNENFNNEFGVLPIVLEKIGRYINHEALADATTVSVRKGSEAQYVRIYIINSNQNKIKCGSAFRKFVEDDYVPYSVREKAWDAASDYRTPVMMSYLLFGGNSTWGALTTNDYDRLDKAGTQIFNVADDSVAPASSGWLTYAHEINGASTDTSGAWQCFNTSLIQKTNNRKTSATVTETFELTANHFGDNNTVTPYLRFYKYSGGPALFEVAGAPTLDGGAALGVKPTVTYTIPFSLLDLVLASSSSVYYVQQELRVTASVGDTGLVATWSTAGHSAGMKMSITSTGLLTSPGYVDPASFTKYGKPDEWCLCDDLVHQFDVIY